MSGDPLPSYDSLTNPPPGYNREPLQDEQTLASTPRPGLGRRQSTNLVKCFKEVIVIFTDQEEDTGMPTYSRGATINGEIGLACPERILEVTIKVRLIFKYPDMFAHYTTLKRY